VQMRILTGFAGASLIGGLFAWGRDVVAFTEVMEGRGPGDQRYA
jgi:hypothetical protein